MAYIEKKTTWASSASPHEGEAPQTAPTMPLLPPSLLIRAGGVSGAGQAAAHREAAVRHPRAAGQGGALEGHAAAAGQQGGWVGG